MILGLSNQDSDYWELLALGFPNDRAQIDIKGPSTSITVTTTRNFQVTCNYEAGSSSISARDQPLKTKQALAHPLMWTSSLRNTVKSRRVGDMLHSRSDGLAKPAMYNRQCGLHICHGSLLCRQSGILKSSHQVYSVLHQCYHSSNINPRGPYI